MILITYSQEPVFPATNQRPEALRALVSGTWVDYVDALPTAAEVTAFLDPPNYPDPFRARTLLAIAADVNALTGAQKTAIWTDLQSGSPPKWSRNRGPNAAAIAVLQLLAGTGSLSAADMLSAKVRAVAMIVQDNPAFLVNPAFDPTIFVSGRA